MGLTVLTPDDFGTGGSGLTPGGSASVTLKDILQDHETSLLALEGASAVRLQRAVDAAAGTLTAETPFYRATKAETITAINYVPNAALVASDTVYATITIRKRDGAGGAAAVVATLITNLASGDWVAWIAKSLGALTNATLAAGSILTIEVAKAGAGTAVPAGVLNVVKTP